MIEVLFVFSWIVKASVCFELTETFGKQTIEDGPFGGEFNSCCYHCQLSQIKKGNGGDPWTDGGEVHLNGMITSMDIRKDINHKWTNPLFLIISNNYCRTGSGVDSIRVQYGGTWAGSHGGGGGSSHIFEVNPEAKIVIAQGRAGSKVDQIEFITNEGEVFGPFGGSGGHPFVSSHPGLRVLLRPILVVPSFPLGCYLSYLSGSSGSRLDSLTLHWDCP